ncbi:MAG TPA: hypothetical protein VN885_07185 [Candidatus Acidoferrales bacterium]|nr:hypothetical protein [Candidatus Acidoferrales bacterium]
MAAAATTVLPVGNDDALTVCAISLIWATLAEVLHEGLGHGALALLCLVRSFLEPVHPFGKSETMV